jgi:hypothetical protein
MKIHTFSFSFPFPFGVTDIFLEISFGLGTCGDVLGGFADAFRFTFSTG